MQMLVKTFNKDELKEAIKNSKPIIQQYIKSLELCYKMQQENLNLAIKKLKENK